MRTTHRSNARWWLVALLIALSLGLAGCGQADPQGAQIPGPATERVPDDLLDQLADEGILVEGAEFTNALLAEREALAAFEELGDSDAGRAVTPYSVVVSESDEPQLVPETRAWMIHMPEQDTLTFLDAFEGDHLATLEIGPDR